MDPTFFGQKSEQPVLGDSFGPIFSERDVRQLRLPPPDSRLLRLAEGAEPPRRDPVSADGAAGRGRGLQERGGPTPGGAREV